MRDKYINLRKATDLVERVRDSGLNIQLYIAYDVKQLKQLIESLSYGDCILIDNDEENKLIFVLNERD